jgi:3-dehydroquinate dehydratase type I
MICVSIAESDFTKCLKLVKQYSFIELRLDAGKFTGSQVEEIITACKKSIVTYRPVNTSNEERKKLFISAMNAGANMIDLEIDSPLELRNELKEYAHSKNCTLILSHHNYDLTPGTAMLRIMMEECYKNGADIAKIACKVNSNQDNARLLSLYAFPGRKVILGMGQLGRITRLAALNLGAEFTFAAPDEGSNTAPGQLTLKEFQEIHSILNSNIP